MALFDATRRAPRRIISQADARHLPPGVLPGTRTGPGGPLWDVIWWSRGESNPRPQVFAEQFYMRSCLIWVLRPLIAQQHAIKVPSHWI
jgi:hypothetical protein